MFSGLLMVVCLENFIVLKSRIVHSYFALLFIKLKPNRLHRGLEGLAGLGGCFVLWVSGKK